MMILAPCTLFLVTVRMPAKIHHHEVADVIWVAELYGATPHAIHKEFIAITLCSTNFHMLVKRFQNLKLSVSRILICPAPIMHTHTRTKQRLHVLDILIRIAVGRLADGHARCYVAKRGLTFG